MKDIHGNVLFIIFIAIGLFAALSSAIFSGIGEVSDTRDKDELRLQTVELIQYGGKVKRTIERLQAINGCSDSQLDFSNPQTDPAIWNYANPRSPVDGRCAVFGAQGGQMAYLVLDDLFIGTASDASSPPSGSYAKARYPLFTGSNAYEAASGTSSNAEIMLLVSFVDSQLCQAINQERDLTVTPVASLQYDEPLGPNTLRQAGQQTVGLMPPAGSPPWGCVFDAALYGHQFYYVLDYNPE